MKEHRQSCPDPDLPGLRFGSSIFWGSLPFIATGLILNIRFDAKS